MLMNLNSKPFDGLRMTTILFAGVLGLTTLTGMARPTTNDAQDRGLEISTLEIPDESVGDKGLEISTLEILDESVGDKGLEISARSDRSDRGFGDSRVRLEMILRNAAGKESRRKLEITTLEVPDESVGDKGLIVFSSPRDIDGTALLSHAKILDPDDQWMYLPALKRVKRISSRNKSGPFIGSEFAFEDITGQELNKYEHAWLRTETFAGLACDVIERSPRYKNSGYTKQIAWIDQSDYQLRKIEFYDRKGSLLKTLTYEDYRLYGGKYWRAQILHMVNHQNGKSTDLIYDDYEFGIGLGDRDFVRGALKRLG